METDFLKGSTPATLPADLQAEICRSHNQVDDSTPAASIDPDGIKVGKWTIPPITIRIARLLERIESPFVVPRIDPETGKAVATSPTITDVTDALYIILHQKDPRLLSLLANETAFENAVLNMCGDISMAEMRMISEAITQSIQAADEAAQAAGVESGDGKKEGASRTS